MVKLSNGEISYYHSTASKIWRKEAAEALKRFICHVENSKYKDRIIGYHICDGHFQEWFAWGSATFEKEVHKLSYVCGSGNSVEDCSTPFPDYSKPMLNAFRDWLKTKYKNNPRLLSKTWKEEKVDFKKANIPTRQERVLSEDFIIRDPSKCMKVIDYDACFQDIHSDSLLELCKTAKEQAGTNKIIGVFYGYLWTGFFRGFYMQHTGHLALSKILDSPYIDFIASPCDYENRDVNGVTFSQTIPKSVILHKKLFFNEFDPKTFLTDQKIKWHHKEDFTPRTLNETTEILKRDFSYAQASGTGMWWMDIGNGWFNHKEITKSLLKLREIKEKLLDCDSSSNSEIAVILDEKSLLYERPCQNMLVSLRSVQRQWELAYIGAPFDTYLQSDLVDQNIRDYKMYIFPNNISMTKDEMNIIKNYVRRDGKVSLWFYAPGLIIDNKLSLKHIEDLIGIKIDRDQVDGQLHIDITNCDHPITRTLTRGFSFGPEISRWHMTLFKESGFIEDDPKFKMGPIFYSCDPDVTVLGKLPINTKPGFVVKENNNWTSVYTSIPMISKYILKNIADLAGVHRYIDCGNLVYSNKQFLSIYPRRSGKKQINLPEPKSVIDLWNDKAIADNTEMFEVDMKANSTYMYLLK
jgi:hypothetical protein